jgi:tRNA (cmo5U34)-methyltransferase
MGVASHLRIALSEYDRQIRTLIPDYAVMLDRAASALRTFRPELRDGGTILDLGVGTGALARSCLAVAPHAKIVGIDADAEILDVARRRLRSRARAGLDLVHASFVTAPLPACQAIVASFALHHVRDARRKQRLYGRCHAALSSRGVLVSADCFPSADPRLRTAQLDEWRRHLRRFYSGPRTAAFFRAWAKEDVHFPLEAEVSMMDAAGFRPMLVWRSGAFAVIAGVKGR